MKLLEWLFVMCSIVIMGLAAMLLFGCVGCSGKPCVPITPSSELPTCAQACDHARSMKCLVGTPTPAGAPCESVCERVESHGIQFRKCVGLAVDCAATEACE